MGKRTDDVVPHQFGPQINPLRVGLFNESELPFTPPTLEVLLEVDGVPSVVVATKPDKTLRGFPG